MPGQTLINVCGGFYLTGIIVNESAYPGLGYTAQYSGETLGEATIFIYDLQRTEIPEGSASQIMHEEFARGARELMQISGVRLSTKTIISTPTRKDAFLGAEFVVEADVGDHRTYLLLTGFNGAFVKIRITLSHDVHTREPVDGFVAAVAAQLWPILN